MTKKETIKTVEKENKSEWILTSKKLPKNKEKVLYITKDGKIHSGIYYDENSLNFEWYKFANFDSDRDIIGWKSYTKQYNQEREENQI